MKSYKTISKEIIKINDKIKALEDAISDNRNNAEQVAKLSAEREELRVVCQILRDNYAHALTLAGMATLAEVAAKYNGKPCGDITAKTIYKEMKKRGFAVYFSRSYYLDNKSCSVIKIDDFYTYTTTRGRGYGEQVEVYAPYIETENGKARLDFIGADNKINLAAIQAARPCGEYCETPTKKARQILKAYKKYADAINTAYREQSAINALLPRHIDHFNKVNGYLYGFKYI